MDQIEIHPYDPSWPVQFYEERERLQDCLSDVPVQEIRHFGSTAIPGMPAKPVIDILIAVQSLKKARETFPSALDHIGYNFWQDNPKQDRLFFVKGLSPRGKKRSHHVHVCEYESEMWGQLGFCEFLKNNPAHAKEYASLKEKLALRYHDNREAYTEAKAEFITGVMRKALR